MSLGVRGQSVLLCGLACLAAGLALAAGPVLLRVPLGFLAVLVFPGYAVTVALIPPERRLRWEARVGLAVALSVGLLSIVALGLDATPQHLSAPSLILTVTSITIIASLGALTRGLASGAVAGDMAVGAGTQRWSLSRPTNVALGLLVVAVVAVGVLLATMMRHSYPTTELYVLGTAGDAQSYPRVLRLGEPVPVTIGVTNHEGTTQTYRVVVSGAGIEGVQLGPLVLADGEAQEQQINLRGTDLGEARVVQMMLYRGDLTTPYRQLALVVDVVGRDER